MRTRSAEQQAMLPNKPAHRDHVPQPSSTSVDTTPSTSNPSPTCWRESTDEMEKKAAAALERDTEPVSWDHQTVTREQASEFYLSLRHSIDLARHIYFPIFELLRAIPDSSLLPSPGQSSRPPLSKSLCDFAFDTFVEFDSYENPFPASSFQDFCEYLRGLKHRLDIRLNSARPPRALGMAALLCGGRDALAQQRGRIEENLLASRQVYVLNNHLSTLERLVARLRSNVECDKVIVRLGLMSGRCQRHHIQEVVRQLRKHHAGFWCCLSDLEEHVCCCLSSLNRTRYLLPSTNPSKRWR